MPSVDSDSTLTLNHLFSTIENMLRDRYNQHMRREMSNIGAMEYICRKNSVIDVYIAIVVAHEATNAFGNIRETIFLSHERIKQLGCTKMTLLLIVDNLHVGNNLLDKIEGINDLVISRPLFISLVIKNSNPLGPISFHDGIFFNSINACGRNSFRI